MAQTFKTQSGITYTLRESEEFLEKAFILESDGDFPIKIDIVGVTVELPDGTKKTKFRYNYKNCIGIPDFAVADCVCEYLEENFGK